MAEVPSTFQLETGAAAPSFELPEAGGRTRSLSSLAEGKKALVVVFACNHCPFVVHVARAVGACARDYAARGVQFIAINSNDVANYPADSPEKMAVFARQQGWDFPYLYDESQEVAKAYAAACTPDFYVFDGKRKLAYAGQFDSSRPGNGRPVTGEDLRGALDAVLSGAAVPHKQRPSTGCNIKWKRGNAPAYFG